MSIGTRGKASEKKFRDWCKARSDAHASFAFYRFPDARAGSLVVVPSDFEVLQQRQHYNIEIKEVNHTHLLPKKNFSKDKIARMRKFEMAGSNCVIMVYFVDCKLWRVAPVSWFFERMNEAGSWDMSDMPVLSFVEAVEKIFGD